MPCGEGTGTDTTSIITATMRRIIFTVTVRRHWVDQVVDLPFENMKLMAPAGWHQILAWLYGDYMTPPPEDKQVPTHSSMEIEVYEDVSLR